MRSLLIPVKGELLIKELALLLPPVHVVNDEFKSLVLIIIDAVSLTLVLLDSEYLA